MWRRGRDDRDEGLHLSGCVRGGGCGQRPRAGAFQGRPAGVAVFLGLVGLPAAAQPEEPVRAEEVGDDGKVEDQGEDLQHADAFGEFIDLDGEQDGDFDEGQVFGPAAGPPQTECLDPVDGGVGGDRGAVEVEPAGGDGEEPVEVAEDAGVPGVGERPTERALDDG